MKKIFLFLITILTLSLSYAQPPAGDANIGEVYGDKVARVEGVALKPLKASLASGNAVETFIEGKVLTVCPKKGCWIKLQLADKSTAFVKMKDYAFFVPTALEGKNILIDGKVEIVTTSVKELKHYAEDAKKSQKEIDAIKKPKKEIKILASGIKVIQ